MNCPKTENASRILGFHFYLKHINSDILKSFDSKKYKDIYFLCSGVVDHIFTDESSIQLPKDIYFLYSGVVDHIFTDESSIQLPKDIYFLCSGVVDHIFTDESSIQLPKDIYFLYSGVVDHIFTDESSIQLPKESTDLIQNSEGKANFEYIEVKV